MHFTLCGMKCTVVVHADRKKNQQARHFDFGEYIDVIVSFLL